MWVIFINLCTSRYQSVHEVFRLGFIRVIKRIYINIQLTFCLRFSFNFFLGKIHMYILLTIFKNGSFCAKLLLGFKNLSVDTDTLLTQHCFVLHSHSPLKRSENETRNVKSNISLKSHVLLVNPLSLFDKHSMNLASEWNLRILKGGIVILFSACLYFVTFCIIGVFCFYNGKILWFKMLMPKKLNTYVSIAFL